MFAAANNCVVCTQMQQQRRCGASARRTAVSIERWVRRQRKDRGSKASTATMPSSGKSRRHRKNRPSDAKHKQNKNGNGGGATGVTGLAQQTSPMDSGGPLVPDKLELLSAELTGGPPLPADAAMELSSPPGSDEDNPAFNAFNYWKTPFPDVSVDVVME